MVRKINVDSAVFEYKRINMGAYEAYFLANASVRRGTKPIFPRKAGILVH
jgi:hypothetical protein